MASGIHFFSCFGTLTFVQFKFLGNYHQIFLSGFKVKIVKDGKHDALRGVTKLHRMLQNANSADIDATTGAMNIYFDAEAIVDSVMQECMALWQQKVDCGKCGRVPTVEILRAEEEADTSIRSFCRESVRRSPNVAMLVLSNDASLILGLEGKIYLVYSNGPCGNMPCLAVFVNHSKHGFLLNVSSNHNHFYCVIWFR